jgi:hypothetical protein
MTLLSNLIALQYQKNASSCVLRTLLNCMAVQSFKFCHLSCSSPISGSERPDSQPKSARQAGWSFHCLTAPHSSNHKDSQILLCNICKSKIIQSQQDLPWAKGTLPPGKEDFLRLLKTLWALPPRFLCPWLTANFRCEWCTYSLCQCALILAVVVSQTTITQS